MVEYIEREAALKQAEFVHGKWDDKYISSDKLKSLPAADVRPVIRGEWIVSKDHRGRTFGICSVCGLRQYAGTLNYCSNCGANMRGAKT